MSNTINENYNLTNVYAQHLNCRMTPDLKSMVICEFHNHDSERSIKTSLTLCLLQIGRGLVACILLNIQQTVTRKICCEKKERVGNLDSGTISHMKRRVSRFSNNALHVDGGANNCLFRMTNLPI